MLEQAANSPSPAIVDILLEHGTNLHNSRAIHEALFSDAVANVIGIFDHLTDPTMPSRCNAEFFESLEAKTLLRSACYKKHAISPDGNANGNV